MKDSATRPHRLGTGVAGLLRRRWVFILVGLALGAVVVGAGLAVRPVSYISTATVLVTQTGVDESTAPANGQGRKTGVNLDTEAQLVRSVTVADRASKLLRSSGSRDALVARLKVKIPANTSLLTITYRARTAPAAQRGAQAFATAYLDNRQAVAAANLESQTTSTQQQLTSLRGQLEATAAKLAGLAETSRERAFVQAQADVLTSQVAALSDRLSILQSTTITPGRIIANAPVPVAPDGLPALVLVVLGALATLVAVAVAAVVRDRTDPRLHTGPETERRTGVPVLLDLTGQPVVPDGRLDQEFQQLQNTLAAALPADRRVILVSAATDGAAAGPVAANLTAALAHSGSSALLLCADPASGTGVTLVDDGPGLAEVLTGARQLPGVLRPVAGAPTLHVVVPGEDAHLLSPRLQAPAVEALIKAARGLADFVVIEVAPTDTSADAQTLARWADAALVVVESGRTRLDAVRDGLQQLRQVGLARLGCAVVPVAGGSRIAPATPAAEAAPVHRGGVAAGARRSPGRRRTPPPMARPAGRDRRAR
jgi:Mrp family chromosome partitioning ATPase